jgi:GTPase SAR1 family protein
MENPFKLLESYTKEDKDIWGGRTTEIDHLYNLSFASSLILIYGTSGVGKTSLIQCGLANKFKRTDWHAIWIQRRDDIAESLIGTLQQEAGETGDPEQPVSIPDLVRKIYLKHFKPIYLVFDQLEELFIFGNNNEIQGFITTVKDILNNEIQCKILLVLREEYHGHLKILQDSGIPVFKASVKIEPMSIPDATDSIVKLLDKFNIKTPDGDHRNCAARIAADCATEGRVDLANLQVYLFWVWEKAAEKAAPGEDITFTPGILREIGDGKNMLSRYLNAVVERVSKGKAGGVWYLLQHFVSKSQTKQPLRLDDVQDIDPQTARMWLNGLSRSRLVKCSREGDTEVYFLAHDSLVPLIMQKKTAASRGRNRHPSVQGNPFKGLPSYEEKDATIFFGRSLILRELLAFFEERRLLVIVGPSGSGKSSIIKAGIIPALKKEGYQVLQGEPSSHPMVFGREIIKRTKELNGSNFLLYIDQFEELSTQASTRESEEFIRMLNKLVEDPGPGTRNVKIVLSVRSDYEYEFERSLANWRESKKTVPDLMESAIREIITEPAYLAGLEYKPVYLVDNIVRDVMQANGTLPLLSYALEQMYIEYEKSGARDGYLTEDHYNAIGGVVDGLRLRAAKLYTSSDPDTQRTIKNVMLRMVSLSINEKASKRILSEELIYESPAENERVQKVLNDLVNSRLIVSGPNENGQIYYEPAHDSLIRSWNLIGDWIKQYGKNLLYLQQDLSEAVKKFKANPKKLWHEDSRLDTLFNILQSSDNWLNQQETDFVKKSEQRRRELEERKTRQQQQLIDERDKVIAYEKKQKVLLEERLSKQEHIATLNKEKENALKEKLEEAKAKTRLQKERNWLTLGGLLLLLIATSYAFSQYKKARYNLKRSFSYIDSIKVLRQQDSLSQVKLTKLYDDVNIQADLANRLATEATEARIKADSAAQKEKKARVEVEWQRKELLLQRTALIQSRDSVNRYSQSLQKYSDSLRYQLAIIQSKDKEIEYTKLTASFLTKSRSLMRSDPALAYQLALESLKYDSTNKRIRDYIYDTLNNRNSFYESFILENVYSAFFSDNGKNVLVIQGEKNLTFLDLADHKEIPVQVPAKILSAQFSPIDNSALVSTKNKIYRYNVNGEQKASSESYDNLLKAAYTAKGQIIVVTPNDIRIKKTIDAPPYMTIPTKDNTDDTEVSSNDTLLYVRKNGIIEAHDLINGSFTRIYREPDSFLGKDGDGFIAVNGNEISIARSKGNRVVSERYSMPLENGYTKISIVSITDNLSNILFLAEPEERQQHLQQQQQQQQRISKNFIRSAKVLPPVLYAFTAPRFTGKMPNGIPSSRQIVLSENGDHFITGESGSLTVYDKEGKRLDRFGGYTNYISWTFNPVNTDMVLSMSLGAGGTRLKLWIKGTPDALLAQNKLRRFNPAEIERAVEDIAIR